MKLNRQQQPLLQDISQVNIPNIEKLKLDNGTNLWMINTGSQDLVKVQISIPAGSKYQKQAFIAFFTSKLLKEGSQKYSAAEIAEKLDYYGAYFEAKNTKDMAYVNIYSLNKHLDAVMQIISDVLLFPSFPDQELQLLIQQEKQAFAIQLQKGKIIAQRNFNQFIFGAESPYGKLGTLADYDAITTPIIKQFFQEHYIHKAWHIFVSGKTDQTTINIINKYFGKTGNPLQGKQIEKQISYQYPNASHHFIEHKGALQTALKMGTLGLERMHKDYPAYILAQTILGGYFGSRLMRNIREEKAYTYGIYAGIIHLHQASIFSISSELGSTIAEDALNEINKELKTLRTIKASDEELHLVKNYMAGSLLKSLNGPFALGEMMRMLQENKLEIDYFNEHMNAIQKTTAEDVLYVADRYLNESKMISVLVGKPQG